MNRVVLMGHSSNSAQDHKDDKKYHMKFSKSLADEVRDQLVSRGVDGKRFQTKSCGYDKMKYPADKPEGSRNYRVEVTV